MVVAEVMWFCRLLIYIYGIYFYSILESGFLYTIINMCSSIVCVCVFRESDILVEVNYVILAASIKLLHNTAADSV